MGRLANTSGRQAMRVAERHGFELARKSGDHYIFERSGSRSVPIPDHRELAVGTLRRIISGLGLTVDEFIRLRDS